AVRILWQRFRLPHRSWIRNTGALRAPRSGWGIERFHFADLQPHACRPVSARGNHFQVPNTPEQQLAGIRDVDDERDHFVNFSWLHTAGSGMVLTLSPFYHYNSAHYLGGPQDTPVIPEDDRVSNYAGGVASVSVVRGKHNAHAGLQVFGEHDHQLLGIG